MSPHPAPLTPDQVDELLSAELDGEFDAAAADLGLSVADARALLAKAPGVAERREALGTARDALGTTPAIDEVTDARIRAAAIDAFREERDVRAAPRRSHRWLVYASGGIAAALIGVFALAATTRSSHTKSAESASGVTAAAPTTTRHDRVVAGASSGGIAYGANAQASIGSFANSRQLAAAASRSYESTFAAASAPPQPAKRSESTSSSLAITSTNDEAGIAYAASPLQCTTKSRAVAPADKLVAVSGATLAGKPVLVHVYAHGSEFVVIVLRPDCSMVATERVP